VAQTYRPAGAVGHKTSRFPTNSRTGATVGITTAAPAANDISQGMGQTGGDDCVLTIATNSSYPAATALTLWLWNSHLGDWVTAGAAAATNTKTFGPRAQDVFTTPEGSIWYLQATTNAPAAGTVSVDGIGFSVTGLTGGALA
jgi:hypothetical protein